MTAYVVYGDIHPSNVVHIQDDELKLIKAKLALGVKPENIRLLRKPVNGGRELGVEHCITVNTSEYIVVSRGNYLHLELDEDQPQALPF